MDRANPACKGGSSSVEALSSENIGGILVAAYLF